MYNVFRYPDVVRPGTDKETQVVHLIHTFRAEESATKLLKIEIRRNVKEVMHLINTFWARIKDKMYHLSRKSKYINFTLGKGFGTCEKKSRIEVKMKLEILKLVPAIPGLWGGEGGRQH